MILIKFKNIGKHKELLISNSKTRCSFSILTSYGAALNKLIFPSNNGLRNLMLGYAQESDFESLYRNVILAPFANRIKDGVYKFEDEVFQLPINRPTENNALHGFLYNKSFQVSEMKRGVDNCEIELTYKSDAETGFPFSYIQRVNYQWNGYDVLTVTATVENTSDKTMPYFMGWHPYFKLDETIEACELQFNAHNKIEVDAQKIPTGKVADYAEFNAIQKIEASSFDDAFAMQDDAYVLLKSEASGIGLRLKFLESDLAFKYLQIYTPQDRKSIALEPMTSFADAFNHQKDLTLLQAGEKRNSSFEINLSRLNA